MSRGKSDILWSGLAKSKLDNTLKDFSGDPPLGGVGGRPAGRGVWGEFRLAAKPRVGRNPTTPAARTFAVRQPQRRGWSGLAVGANNCAAQTSPTRQRARGSMPLAR